MIYILRIFVVLAASVNIASCIRAYKEEHYFFCGLFAVLAIYLIYGLCVPLSDLTLLGGQL